MRFVVSSKVRARFSISVPTAILVVLSLTWVVSATVPLNEISTDPFTNDTSQHKTEVEPDVFAAGSTVVGTFQAGRFFDGGASDIGFATSVNNGGSWTNRFLSGITKFQGGGPYDRVSDPSVAFDAKHKVWLISSLALMEAPGGGTNGDAILVSRSTDGGLTWGDPVTVAVETSGSNLDKDWTTCDNTPSSPFYGNCYTEYDDNSNGNRIHMSTSADGGFTWIEATTPSAGAIGGQPVAQPNGTVIVPIDDAFMTAVESFVSADGGVTYSGPFPIATIQDHAVAGGLRTSPLPSAEIDGAGKVYVVWQDCSFRSGCKSNDIVMSTSTNGTTWTPVTRIPIDSVTSTIDHFIPGLAVDKQTSGNTAHLGLTYYFYPQAGCGSGTLPPCRLNVGFISSASGGSNWSRSTKLAGPMTLTWLPNTTEGRMVGDYIATAFGARSVSHPLFALANAPTGGKDCQTATPGCEEATYTPTTGLRVVSSAAPTGFVLNSTGEGPVPNATSDHATPQAPPTAR